MAEPGADRRTPTPEQRRAEVLELVTCPRCGATGLRTDPSEPGTGATCRRCSWAAALDGHVLQLLDRGPVASFDEKHDAVEQHNHHRVVWRLCYERQVDEIRSALRPGAVVLDVGCGPAAPYDAPDDVRIVGVDPSGSSLAVHPRLDLGLHTTADRIPLADGSVDLVLFVYALHHMIGPSIRASRAHVEAALREAARVVRSPGAVLVMEVCPWPPTWIAERLGWRAARRLLGNRVDFLFWPARVLEDMGRAVFPGAHLDHQRFGVGAFAVLPPVIGAPRLKVPRGAYPFGVHLLRWRLGTEVGRPGARA